MCCFLTGGYLRAWSAVVEPEKHGAKIKEGVMLKLVILRSS